MITYDTVWVIRYPEKEGIGIVYAMSSNRTEAWIAAAEKMCSTRYALEKRGFRAVRVDVVGLGK